ncbi:21 kDa protein-like isoform X2 [Cucurbita moschata]|uniref:21 kDa protein-like isoform X2 n=1 Tax=Cucurbita moschata TaxID=3662 RepID=A0A6J1FS20_CUCMO|nr:21 kDa protein-like isoform X2 [Cucurbita moschata]
MGFSICKQSLILLVAIFQLTLNPIFIHSAITPQSSSSSTEFIKTSCSSTTYPRLCFSSLSLHAASIQTSPRLLATAALSVSISSVKSATTQILKLSHAHGLSPRDVSALNDCLEELGDSVDSLISSISEMPKLRGNDFDVVMSNIQTWVSAALTDETTCSEGFQGKAVNSGVKAVVRSKIVNIAQLTSNALSLINRIAELH